MSYGRSKRDNEYARELLDVDAPKTVFMAIAFAFALRLVDDDRRRARQLVEDEWRTLHENGIVPQRPRKTHS